MRLTRKNTLCCLPLALALGGVLAPFVFAAQVITLDPATKYQTITGWEVVAQAAQEDSSAFEDYRDAVFDGAVNDIGITRVRLEVRAGAENSHDYWADYRSGKMDHQKWRTVRYAMVNDNDDPEVINPAGFQFASLDNTIENVVLPLRKRMEARGEKLFVNVDYVGFDAQKDSGTAFVHDKPEEYAEFVLATYQHMRDKYGFAPDAWEVVLEPDHTPPWNGNLIGRTMVASAARLREAGFTPHFIAPSTSVMANAIPHFDQMKKVPGATQDLIEISYHRYAGTDDSFLRKIAARAAEHQMNTAMLEWWDPKNCFKTLHKDLAIGRNSAWEQGTIAGPTRWGAANNSCSLYVVDDSKPDEPVITMTLRTKFTRQYYRFIRPGAVRIGAASAEVTVDPLAFINADGRFVVVVKAEAASEFAIVGLPAGTYGIKYTTGDGTTTVKEYDKNLPDVMLAAGQDLQAAIPDQGVITVYAKAKTAKP
jgi:O-glycosyl hydrolase